MDNSSSTSTANGSSSSQFPMTPAAIALPAVALFTLVMDSLPFMWHVRNGNLAASSLIFYILFANLMNFINPLIWATDDIGNWFSGFGLCDLEVKLMLGIWMGVVSSLVSVMRTLARVLDTDHPMMNLTKAERRRQTLIDCFLCFGAPLYMMAIHYIVQSNRYFIFAISGCTASFDDSWPSLVLVFIWPPIFCLANLYFAVIVIIRMHRYRSNFSAILNSTTSSFNKSRFMRLFWMSLTLVVAICPVEFYVLYKNAENKLAPYSWARVHGLKEWAVVMVPTHGQVSFDRWVQIGAGILVFFYFGMGQDAMKQYRKALLNLGLGRIFPCLARERSTRQYPMGSRASSSSRLRLFGSRKAPLSSHSILLTDANSPGFSPYSRFTSSRSGPPTPANTPKSSTFTVGSSTAPSTLSRYLAEEHDDGPDGEMSLRNFLHNELMAIERQQHESSISVDRLDNIITRLGDTIHRSSDADHEGAIREV